MGLSAAHAKGIEIEIGGNTTKLKTAMDSANKSIRTTQTELDTLKNALKLEWNPENFKRAQELSQRAVQQTAEKAELLKKALAELDKQGDNKKADQYEAVRRELSYVQVAAQKAQGELEKLNRASLDRLAESIHTAGDNLNRMGSTLTMGLTVPLAAAGVASVNYASDTAESLNKVEVAFGSASAGIEKWSNSTLTAIGLAKGTALDMAAQFGDMATSMGFGQDEAAKMSQTLVNLAGDMASFKNISFDQVQTALDGIFTGESESMKKLGVIITETNMKAYAMSQGIEKNFESFTQAEKVALRYKYVLEATANSQGDFARTSDGTANQLRILQESLKEAAATAGNELLPVITPIITNLNGLIQSFGNLDEGTRKAVVQAGLFLAALGPMMKLTGGLTTAVSAGVTAFTALKTALAAKQAADIGATATQTGLNVAMNANPVGAVVTAIGTLVAVLGSFALTASLTGEKQDDLNAKLRDTVEASEASAESIRTDTAAKTANLDAVSNLLPKIEELNGKTVRTQEEQHRLNGLVATANELYPGLIGSVDELTGSYEFNRAAIEGNIDALKRQFELEANQDIIAEKYRAMAELKQQMTEADKALIAAEADAAVQHAELLEVLSRPAPTEYALRDARFDAELADKHVQQAKDSIQGFQDEISGLENEAEGLLNTSVELAGATNAVAQSTEAASAASAEASKDYATLASELDSAAKSFADVSAGQEMGTASALKLQSEYAKLVAENGDLLAQYPELYAALDQNNTVQENGAALAKSIWGIKKQLLVNELQAQADSISAQIQNYQSLKAAAVEAYAAIGKAATIAATLAIGVVAPGLAKPAGQAAGAAVDGAMKDLSGPDPAQQDRINQLNALNAQIQALKNSDAGSYAVKSSGGGSSKGSGSSKKEQTQEEKNLESYQNFVKDIQFQRDMDRMNEADYFAQKKALAERYLAADSDERRAWDVEYHKYQQGAYDRDLAELDLQLEAQKITRDEHYSQFVELQSKYLAQGSKEWLESEQQRQDLQESAYDAEMADQKYFLDMGLTTETNYYIALSSARDQYLQEDSESWRKSTLELENWKKQQREQSANDTYDALVKELQANAAAYEEAQKRQEEAIKAATAERIAAIQAEQQAEEDRIAALIAGIDAEIAARRRLREEEGDQDKIADAQKRLDAALGVLDMARTEADRAEAQKEVIRKQEELDKAKQEKADNDFYFQKEQEKAALQGQLEAVKEQYQGQIDSAEDAVRKEFQDAQNEATHAYNSAQEKKRREEAALKDAQNAAGQAQAQMGKAMAAVGNVLNQVTNTVQKSIAANVNINTAAQSDTGTQRAVERALNRAMKNM